MGAKIFSCNELANKMYQKCLFASKEFQAKYKRLPSLAVILVGEDSASKVYVNKKKQACQKCGIEEKDIHLNAETKEKELIECIESLNKNPNIDGILIQSPLPKHITENIVFSHIYPQKDVDCFHPINLGKFYLDIKKTMEEWIAPCTPSGVLAVLEENNITIAGKHAVVIGRSHIVGKPMSQILLSRDATVTICHSYTKNLKEVCKKAHILVSAVGKAKMITEEYIMPDAVLIDVGISRFITKEGKSILQGDIDQEGVSSKASFLTPVPGGIGLMTIAMLMKNTIRLAFLRQETRD